MRRRRVGPLQVVVYLLIAFLYLPLAVVVLFAFNGGSNLSWPVQGLSLRWFRLVFGDPAFSNAFQNSFKAAVIVAVCSAVIATSAALVFTRRRSRVNGVMQALALLPAMMPPLFIAIALFTTMDELNIQPGLLPIVVGHLVVVIPFVLVVVTVRLQRFDIELEQASRDLGAGVS